MAHVDLWVLDACKLKWRLPEDPVADAVLTPALHIARSLECMVGYFGGRGVQTPTASLAKQLISFLSESSAPAAAEA